jgi:hypothetical protein
MEQVCLLATAPKSAANALCSPPPELPFSSHSRDCAEIYTNFPNYSTHAPTLHSMLREQSHTPPSYFVQLTGNHTVKTKRNGETKHETITDFVLKINITSLLTDGPGGRGEVRLLPDNKRGYRGGRIPSLHPTMFDLESQGDDGELLRWCEDYVSNRSVVKSFTLKREIENHNTEKLTQLLHSAISETGYRGRLTVKYPTMYKSVVVYSPGIINTMRTITWIRWLFYLTFLWVITWPVLYFMTAKYEVVKAVFEYQNRTTHRYKVMSEVEWFQLWRGAIKRAAVARMDCKDVALSEDYRIEASRADAEAPSRSGFNGIPGITGIPRLTAKTGNAVLDAALQLGEGVRGAMAGDWDVGREWGGDVN